MTDSDFQNCAMCCMCCGLCATFRKTEKLFSSIEETKIVNSRFVGELPQFLHPGHLVVISGTPEAQCTRFSINFTCGKGEDPDIAFHFNPRLEENYVVRNCRLNGHWGKEETTASYALRMARKQKFKLEFLMTEKQFIVDLNSTQFCEYRYKVPLNKVKHIEIIGDVDVHEVDTREVTTFPLTPRESLWRVPFGDKHNHSLTLPIPFVGRLEDILQIGQQVEVIGRVKLLPYMFYVNLQEGNLSWPHPQIPIHLNPRFNTSVGAYSLVRNAWYKGTWGPEERTPGFSFSAGKRFHIVIRCEIDHFTVWVDNKMVGLFKFRAPTHQIDTVHIEGDVVIYKVFVSDRNLLLTNS